MPTQVGVPSTFRPYVIIHSTASMPASVRSPYRYLAIMRTDGARVPRLISECRGATIAQQTRALSARGRNSAFARALAEAIAECRRLNDDHESELMRAIGVPPWRIAQVEQERQDAGGGRV